MEPKEKTLAEAGADLRAYAIWATALLIHQLDLGDGSTYSTSLASTRLVQAEANDKLANAVEAWDRAVQATEARS